ncbi:hypothetical protein GJ496_008082 [Pomphorhynchus laevis]|nr:hypothetical protein GJ496_008082 [Pomphorhynchus laevis]
MIQNSRKPIVFTLQVGIDKSFSSFSEKFLVGKCLFYICLLVCIDTKATYIFADAHKTNTLPTKITPLLYIILFNNAAVHIEWIIIQTKFFKKRGYETLFHDDQSGVVDYNCDAKLDVESSNNTMEADSKYLESLKFKGATCEEDVKNSKFGVLKEKHKSKTVFNKIFSNAIDPPAFLNVIETGADESTFIGKG